MKKPRTKYGLLGLFFTTLWFFVVGAYLFCTNSNPFKMPPNEFGDFWAGAVGPVALLWIVLGFWQQGQELRNSVDALELQSKELGNSVDQQKALVETAKRQLDQEVKSENEKRIRALSGHRAGMLIALSEITEYSENCIDHINDLKSLWSNDKVKRPYNSKNELPLYPQSAFDKIQIVIENSDPLVAENLAEFIALSQVQRSRISELLPSMNGTGRKRVSLSKSSFHEHLFDALGLKKYADRIYEYGRLQRNNLDDFCSGEDAVRSLRFLLSHSDKELSDLIEERWPPSIGKG